ncbi:Bacilysin biosynthesis protein BacB [Legionella birminghamensis]|uniref:Bacilysin biosynthesis protein BacB n=1 Tax=Legionella birminghamensis TaxID=28083 RepID=A0A378I7Q1_9GAMM|nr:cupin domain-containing protein [Legionella birminghamensis]KTC76062.1 Bacilysin biosynthesis protein BacB [Legionella birminghamensis]STX30775.1 Bacilysin biosynthesis protein BacB [Legionella birminghamensis]
MSHFFPVARQISPVEGIDSYIFNLNDTNQTTIMISYLQPDAELKQHAHPERQLGMALKGSFTIQIDGKEEELYELKNAYAVPPNVPHSAINRSGQVAVGLDIKRSVQAETFPGKNDYFIYPENKRTLKTGINMCFFVSSWCELMLSTIPKQASMPAHRHLGEQIGIAVHGNYLMQVGEEEENFHFGKIYYAPESISHGAYNPFEETAISLNLFLPHRYNKPLKYTREI